MQVSMSFGLRVAHICMLYAICQL